LRTDTRRSLTSRLEGRRHFNVRPAAGGWGGHHEAPTRAQESTRSVCGR